MGTGSRMKANMPKQFLELRGITILEHSLNLFLEKLPAYMEEKGLSGPSKVILVVDPKYQSDYGGLVEKYKGKFEIANPGEERQGSVENGLMKMMETSNCAYVGVHDSA